MPNYKTNPTQKCVTADNRPAIALVLTLVVLVVLTTIVYTLTSRLASIKHRRQYIIDYQISRYACDSAMKYALAAIEGMSLRLIKRDDKPDFSDLFLLNQAEYEQFLADWADQQAERLALEDIENQTSKRPDYSTSSRNQTGMPRQPASLFDQPETTDSNQLLDEDDYLADNSYYIDPNTITIPGPYGPPWPYVQKPIEFEIGSAKITIEIEDENAKMPLTWAITKDKEVNRQAQDALQTFCEWMQMDPDQIEELNKQLEIIGQTKQFTINAKPVTYTEQIKTTTRTKASSRRARRRGSRRSPRTRTTTRNIKKTRSAIKHTTDFAELLHSSLLDRQALARPLPDTGDRHESPLKYLALWGSQKVNINTAPRHVLEAAFTFGGDAEEIAHEIIQTRREKPFKNIDELESLLYRYSESIRKAKSYITTTSKFFAVKVTAVSGSARTSAVATVIKEGRKVSKIAIISN